VQKWPIINPRTCCQSIQCNRNHKGLGRLSFYWLHFQYAVDLAPLLLSLKIMEYTPQHDVSAQPANSIDFKSILLVDDDAQLAEALQWILADAAFLVDVAHNGEEALPKIKEHQYDAIVCDVMMPKLRGDELFQRAIELRPYLSDRFIFITGFAADPKINLFLCKTGSKYLMKPFPVQTLIDCVKQLLA